MDKASTSRGFVLKPVEGRFSRRRHSWRLIVGSAGVRFAAAYALVFGISAFALAVSVWYSTVRVLESQVEYAIYNDARALTDHYSVDGLPSLVDALRGRLQDHADPDGIYLLIDPLGNRLVGNLDQWPKGIIKVGTFYQLPVMRQGAASVALMRAYTLDDGAEMLVGRDVRARTQLRVVLRDSLLWAFGLMIGLGVMGALFMRSVFRRTIRDISSTTRAIARGDLTKRIPIKGFSDEFDELADTINDMLERISRLMDGVRQVSNAIAHDLRTPITRVRTRLEDASLRAHSPEDMRDAIERGTHDLDDIVRVFEALLRIAEIEAGSRRAAFAPINLTPMLHDIDELYRAAAEECGLRLRTLIDDDLPLLGDRHLIQQAVANLIDNALKFSPFGTQVSFTAQLKNGTIDIVVADRGPGIAEADRARAVDRFYRADSARNTPGSGLGLSLVAAVAQLHNGTLTLEDNIPGLRARLTLPVNNA